MKDNNRDKQYMEEIIYDTSRKYFIIGFIIGVIPFMILILILNNSTQISNIEHLKRIIPIIGIITAFINGWVLQYKVHKKLLEEI